MMILARHIIQTIYAHESLAMKNESKCGRNKLENEHKGRVATKNCAHIQKQAKKVSDSEDLHIEVQRGWLNRILWSGPAEKEGQGICGCGPDKNEVVADLYDIPYHSNMMHKCWCLLMPRRDTCLTSLTHECKRNIQQQLWTVKLLQGEPMKLRRYLLLRVNQLPILALTPQSNLIESSMVIQIAKGHSQAQQQVWPCIQQLYSSFKFEHFTMTASETEQFIQIQKQ
ncbi:hypothetical protein HKD37_18G049293 [Glycine soja]